jgi:hypothetical protein
MTEEPKKSSLGERAAKAPVAAAPPAAPAGTKLRSSLGEAVDQAQREAQKLLDRDRQVKLDAEEAARAEQREAVHRAILAEVPSVVLQLGAVRVTLEAGLEESLRREVVELTLQAISALSRWQRASELVAERRLVAPDDGAFSAFERTQRAEFYRVKSLLGQLIASGYAQQLATDE